MSAPHIVMKGAAQVSRLSGGLAAILLAVLFMLMFAEVFSRNFMGRSLHVSWEISSYLMAAVVFLAAGMALEKDVHVRVAILLENLPPRALRWLEALVTLGGIAMAGYVTYALGALTWRSYSGGLQSWTGFGISLWVPQGTTALGAAIFVLQLCLRLARLVTGLPPDTPDTDAVQGKA